MNKKIVVMSITAGALFVASLSAGAALAVSQSENQASNVSAVESIAPKDVAKQIVEPKVRSTPDAIPEPVVIPTPVVEPIVEPAPVVEAEPLVDVEPVSAPVVAPVAAPVTPASDAGSGAENDVNDDKSVTTIAWGNPLDLGKYTGSPVEKEMAYAHEYWNTKGPSAYTYLTDVNCANFVNQALRARGWTMNGSWYNNGGNNFSSSWVSSTALKRYIASRGDAVELNDSQRGQVKIGDVAQFDWDNSGDRDHTAIVSKIETQADGHIKIYVIEHTDHAEFRDVDKMVTVDHPGASVFYWSLS